MSEASEKEEGRMRVMRDALWYRTDMSRHVVEKAGKLRVVTRHIRARIGHIFQRKTSRGGLPSFTEE